MKSEIKIKYNEDGSKSREHSYLNGVRHGIQRSFNRSGVMIEEYLRMHGKWVGMYQLWNIDKSRDCILQYKIDFIEHGPKIDLRYEK